MHRLIKDIFMKELLLENKSRVTSDKFACK
jgi:hypothetical protein